MKESLAINGKRRHTMTTDDIPLCYLRTFRRLWGLTQKELATLLGFKSRTHMSRLENSKCAPTIKSAFACQVVFGRAPSDMFPQLFAEVEERVIRHVYERHEALSDTTNPKGLRKRQLFGRALNRAVANPNSFDHADAAENV